MMRILTWTTLSTD